MIYEISQNQEEDIEDLLDEDVRTIVVLWSGSDGRNAVPNVENYLKQENNTMKIWSWISEPNQASIPWMKAVEIQQKKPESLQRRWNWMMKKPGSKRAPK